MIGDIVVIGDLGLQRGDLFTNRGRDAGHHQVSARADGRKVHRRGMGEEADRRTRAGERARETAARGLQSARRRPLPIDEERPE